MSDGLTIPAEMIERVLRDEIAARLPERAELHRLRLELMLTIATISSEEGGACLGLPARRFRDLCEKNGVPQMPFGHRTVRYRIADVSHKIDKLAVAAKKDLEEARAAMVGEVARISGEFEKLRSHAA
jgi:hypothetical protein